MKNVRPGFLMKPFLLGIMLLFGACKQGGKSQENKHEDQLIVELRIKIPKDDQFELFYRDEDEDYNAERSVSVDVKGAEEFQIVEYVIDLLEFPTHIRIDFGKNREQGEMTFGHLAFRYNETTHTFTKEEIKKYFRPNPGLDFNFQDFTVRTVDVNGKYVPYLHSFNIGHFVNKVILF